MTALTLLTSNRRVRRYLPHVAVVFGCVGLAALTLLRPSAPTTDPWGWIVWGREVLHLGLDTTAGTPAWKPLPVLITTPLALFGPAAPMLWLVVARTAALLCLVIAFRMARRASGTVAGCAAALFVALLGGFVREFEHGYSEPLLALLALLAVDRHFAGQRLQALALGTLVCLGRPEALAFVLVYAAFAWRVLPGWRGTIAALVGLVPLLWMGGDWWGAGDPLHARQVAAGAGSRIVAGDMLSATALLAGLPLLAPAAFAWWSHRSDRRIRALAGGALGWVALLSALVAVGYPGSERFMVLPAVAVCVLAGVGVGDLLRARPRRGWIRIAAVALLLAALAIYLPPRLQPLRGQMDTAESQGRSQQQLRDVVRAADRVGPECGHPMLPTSFDWDAGAVAWELNVPLERVDSAFGAARMLASTRPLIGLAVMGRGRPDEALFGLDAPVGRGAEVYIPGPVSKAIVDPGLDVHIRVAAGNRHWSKVAVCPRPGIGGRRILALGHA